MRRFHSPRLVVAVICAASWLAAIGAADPSGGAMATAATKFLSALTPQQRTIATFPFDGDERLRWHFIPTEMFPRKGLTIKEMSEPQRALARELLKSGLSQRGYATATSIMDLETILKALEENGQLVRDPERYFFSVFGTPAGKGAWGWRVDGHHVSLHFTIVDGLVASGTPTFFGTNPAEVRSGPKQGLRILAPEEDAGRALLQALDPAQRGKAVINQTAPGDIVTMNKVPIEPLQPAGVVAGELSAAQRELLMRVIDAYTSLMASDIAADRMSKIRKAGLDKIGFAWAGEGERGKKHYYRVQGPTFLIEYDNTQNDANHVHSVWRDFDGDFGRDLLRDHVRSAH
jgi:hypothetical protein